jgi:hypothetical protein
MSTYRQIRRQTRRAGLQPIVLIDSQPAVAAGLAMSSRRRQEKPRSAPHKTRSRPYDNRPRYGPDQAKRRTRKRGVENLLRALPRNRIGPLSPVRHGAFREIQVFSERFVDHAQGLPQRVSPCARPRCDGLHDWLRLHAYGVDQAKDVASVTPRASACYLGAHACASHKCPHVSGTDCHWRARFPWSLAYRLVSVPPHFTL